GHVKHAAECRIALPSHHLSRPVVLVAGHTWPAHHHHHRHLKAPFHDERAAGVATTLPTDGEHGGRVPLTPLPPRCSRATIGRFGRLGISRPDTLWPWTRPRLRPPLHLSRCGGRVWRGRLPACSCSRFRCR